MARRGIFWSIVAVVTCAKFLLLPSYRSTDFEVHRNWLAITHSLPIAKWYYEETSEWTLDYPPFFAWFEWLLSQFAKYFDPQMLQVTNLNYASQATVFFQRLSVILTDFFLVYAVQQFCKLLKGRRSQITDEWLDQCVVLPMLVLWNPGLLIVDHIHFQYNGFLSGIWLLAVARAMEGRSIESALWFSTLLNLKHIYIYVAPAFFVYLLRSFCFVRDGPEKKKKFDVANFSKLGLVVAATFGLSLGPFVLKGQLGQVLSRLFPFKRGLTHAYWAPNFWALYNGADKSLSILGTKLFGWNVTHAAAMTGGLVQEFDHSVLPGVRPWVTLSLTALSIIPGLLVIWKRHENPWNFLRGVVLCAFGAFLFGWHVHEKAILMVILPLTPLALVSYSEAAVLAFLSPVAHFSLFPLLHQPAETPLKILLLLLHSVYIFTTLKKMYKIHKSYSILPFLSTVESIYLLGLFPLQAMSSCGWKVLQVEERLPFLPLMTISLYCAMGVIYAWIKATKSCLNAISVDETDIHKIK